MKTLGTVKTIDSQTGEVIAVKEGGFTLLPPPPGTCAECAVDHAPEQPHNQQSLHYQYWFYGTHGKLPTWSDAMAHCSAEMQAAWREKLIEVHKENGLAVPEDLL